MRFEFTDMATGAQLIAVNSTNTDYAMNMFNLFMAEMVRMYGRSFEKLSSEVRNKDENIIHLIYSHNIVGDVQP